MFTLVAYSNAKDCLGVFTPLPAVPDQHVKTQTIYITVPIHNQIIGVYGLLGANGNDARLVAPSLRRTNPVYVQPAELVDVPSADPLMMFHPESPIPLDINESLEAEVDADNADVGQKTVGVWLSDGVQTPVHGEIFTVNAEVNVALVLDTWEFTEITFPDSLPVADYQVVGARLISASGALFRFVPVGKFNRPGGVSASAVNGKDPFLQRYGRLGVWFDFNTVQPPGLEVLGGAAVGAADLEMYIDLIKT